MNPLAAHLWSKAKPDAAGLVSAVVQDARTLQVLMLGHMNERALAATLESGLVTFFSRSRQKLWQKGETSGHVLELVSLREDCDGDAFLVRAIPHGPTCHTGSQSCFFRGEDDRPAPETPGEVFARVFSVVLDRKAGRGATNKDGKSYVRSLLDKGAPKIGAKLTEEAGELAAAISEESDERVASEAADLLFHMMVGLAHRDLSLREVAAVLAGRFGQSGIDEKAGR